MMKAKSTFTIVDNQDNDDDYKSDSEDSEVKSVTTKVNPGQFDEFIPWVCSQWCASTTVVVTRMLQDEYGKKGFRTMKQKVPLSTESFNISQISEAVALHMLTDHVLPISAYYNNKKQLVEISIIGCSFTISRKVIHAFSLCVPFHPTLTRFTMRRGGLSPQLIYEINKLFSISNITEICFDDSYVQEGNYYILLEQNSQLKYLSLNRCAINDEICVKLAANIDYGTSASNGLQILELSSNEITDIGAQAFGLVLKKNRCLLHLNLSGNKITDAGFRVILNTLMEFPLSYKESMDLRRGTFRYLQDKAAVYERCLEDLRSGTATDNDSVHSSRKKMLTAVKRRKHKKATLTESTIRDQAEMMAKEIVGEYKDPYCLECVRMKNGLYYSMGNLTLCSINMAYNELEFPSVEKVLEVVSYQCYQGKTPPDTGLLRINLDGNYIPSSCSELRSISDYLERAIAIRAPPVRKTRTSSIMRRL